jgi:pimeloyl-ACP methyl ester carboxylesterase
MTSPSSSSMRRRLLVVGGSLAAGFAAGAAYRKLRSFGADSSAAPVDDGRLSLGWGEGVPRPDHIVVRTEDGAELAVWDLEGPTPDAPVVVLPHCWGCTHEIWLPVTRRLRELGHRVVLYDQRGHGLSTRGSAPLDIETLGQDLALVLEATDVHGVVLAGHSMGGMTIMSLGAHHPEVMRQRATGAVLVATAATNGSVRSTRGAQLAGAMLATSVVTRSLTARNGHVLVRSAFGANPVREHVDLTRQLFAGCDRLVRGDFLVSMAGMNLLEGIATIEVPTTVMVGGRDRLTLPKRADEIVSAIPGARLVRLPDRGHMLPLEDPDAVTDEIARATKG